MIWYFYSLFFHKQDQPVYLHLSRPSIRTQASIRHQEHVLPLNRCGVSIAESCIDCGALYRKQFIPPKECTTIPAHEHADECSCNRQASLRMRPTNMYGLPYRGGHARTCDDMPDPYASRYMPSLTGNLCNMEWCLHPHRSATKRFPKILPI